MSRLMSVSLTEQAVVERRKTVTRRLGWEWLKPGDRLTLCRKVMGRRRKDGTVDPLVRLAEVRVIDVKRQKLNWITPPDVTCEGFPDWSPADFVAFFVRSMRCAPDAWVQRIEWTYVRADIPDPPGKETP